MLNLTLQKATDPVDLQIPGKAEQVSAKVCASKERQPPAMLERHVSVSHSSPLLCLALYIFQSSVAELEGDAHVDL